MSNDAITRVISVKTELDKTGQWPGMGACLSLLELTTLEKGAGFPTLCPGLHFSQQPWDYRAFHTYVLPAFKTFSGRDADQNFGDTCHWEYISVTGWGLDGV